MPPVATIAEGMVLLQHANNTKDIAERTRMLRLAVESFEEAVVICPTSAESLVRLSDGLYQLALPATRYKCQRFDVIARSLVQIKFRQDAVQLLKSSLARAETALQIVTGRLTVTNSKDSTLSDPAAAAIHEDSRITDTRRARNLATQSSVRPPGHALLRLASRKLLHTEGTSLMFHRM